MYNEPDPIKIIWDFREDTSLPGHKYNSDQQCAQFFGPIYSKYRESLYALSPRLSNPCTELLCYHDLVLVSAETALEGTDCTNQSNSPGQCKVGKCV